jgi:hypothetical protein
LLHNSLTFLRNLRIIGQSIPTVNVAIEMGVKSGRKAAVGDRWFDLPGNNNGSGI